MGKFDHTDAISRYRQLLRARPDLVVNPTGGTIEILLEQRLIEEAQSEARATRIAQGMSGEDIRCGVLAQDPYMTFLRDAVRFADGQLGLYNRIIEGPCVAVLPVIDKKPVLIRIFRHGLRKWLWEAPRGDVKRGESFSDAAKRELREEIDADVVRIEDLGPFTPGGASLGISAALCYAIIDRVGTVAAAESISEARAMEIVEMESMIADGTIEDGFTIALFARARLRKLL